MKRKGLSSIRYVYSADRFNNSFKAKKHIFAKQSLDLPFFERVSLNICVWMILDSAIVRVTELVCPYVSQS